MKIKLLSFFVMLLIAGAAMGQSAILKQANLEFEKSNYFDAKDLYKKAFSKEKDKAVKAEILFKIGECYRMFLDTKNQIAWYDKAVKANYPDPIALLYLAQAQKMSGKYADATVTFNKYKAAAPTDKRGEEGAQSCELAAKWVQKPTRYTVSNMVSINSKFSDFAAAYAKKDYRVLFFTSNKEESMGAAVDEGTGYKFTDIYETTLDRKGKWSTPKPIPAPVNSPVNEGAACFDRKYSEMFFTRSGFAKGKDLRSKIYVTKRRGQTWDEPVALPFCNNDSATYGHPSLSADGTHLYFASDMPGGHGGLDIWVSTYDKSKKAWGDPVNLGPNINTDGNEMYPYIRNDGVLFFSSDGHLGMGGLDIFKATFANNEWGDVTNMKYPINSPADDFAIIFEDGAERGYLSSNRDGGKGSDDIYSFNLPPIILTLRGVARNKDNGNPIPEVKIEMVGSDGSSISQLTDKTGAYKFDSGQFHPNVSYKLTATKKDYLGDKGEVSTVGQETSKDYVLDFKLKPIIKKPIVLPNVLYVFDKTVLIPVSNASLDSLVKILDENPTITIELDANTDARGSEEYNQKLSQGRAETVVNYLVDHGIDKDRLTPVGQGKMVPRTLEDDEKVTISADGSTLYNGTAKTFSFKKGDNLTMEFINKIADKDEQEAAHQLNRRTEFKILRQDFAPKPKK